MDNSSYQCHKVMRLPMLGMVIGLMLAAHMGLTGCASNSSSRADADYVFVYLKSGPKSGQGDKETRQKMFAGHMGNIQRLADGATPIESVLGRRAPRKDAP
ncbi:MAG: hypothetical protein KGS45_14110 [Planctomycetes bacterium]|nr:hypothetical protein [Planctomycetota bacterium]